MKNRILIYAALLALILLNIITLSLLLYEKRNNRIIEDSEQHTESLAYRSVVVAKNNRIKLGEEYIANVFLCVIDSTNLPTVLVNDSLDLINPRFESLKDTVSYNTFYQTYIYRFTPTATGEYKWGGLY